METQQEVKCPGWCTEPEGHEQDRALQFHRGPSVWVTNWKTPATNETVRVLANAETVFGEARPPVVTFFASGEHDATFADLTPKDARVIADVIGMLSGMTPEQHEEYAAGIYAAAEAIENEPEAE